jgi:hypothetical protein
MSYGPLPVFIVLLATTLIPCFSADEEKSLPEPLVGKNDLIDPDVYVRATTRKSEWKRKQVIEGPFGTLELQPMTIQPPLDYLKANYEEFSSTSMNTHWKFKGLDREKAENTLRSLGCTEDFIAEAFKYAHEDVEIGGVRLELPFEVYRSMENTTRIRVLRYLLKLNGKNPNKACRLYLYGNFDTWTKQSRLKPETLALIREFIHEENDMVFFYDVQTLYEQLIDEQEKLHYIQLVCRYASLNVHLQTSQISIKSLEGLIRYWGVQGRRSRVEQIIEAALGNEHIDKIDITQILPPFARLRVNLYLDDYERGTMHEFSRDCKWSSFNFFNDIPDERFGTDDEGPDLMNAAFDEVPGPERLGDIILMLDKNDEIVHACVHIAGPVVFTKNGLSDLIPFVLTYRDDVETIYSARGAVRNVYLRARYIGPTQRLKRRNT